MDLTDIINLTLRIMTISGLLAGLVFIGLQMLIKKLERKKTIPLS